MDARNELVGHATLAVLSLLGMALYSATYALVYASASAKTPPVAALEFWMTTLHLFSSAGCCVGQALSMSFFRLKTPVRHVAEAQTALFLGVACGVTTLGSACLGAPTDHQGAECAVYFGSAALPRAAAAGAITWSWIMYVSSLGCQSWTGREGQAVSLGLRGISGLTAFAVMALLPWILLDKLVRTCGDRWKILLCSDVKVSVSADMAASTVSANCTHIETALGLSCTIVCIALLLAWIGNAIQFKFAGRIMCFVAALLATGGQLVLWSMQPSSASAKLSTTVVPYSFYAVSLCLAFASMLSLFWNLWTLRRRAQQKRERADGRSASAPAPASFLAARTSAVFKPRQTTNFSMQNV